MKTINKVITRAILLVVISCLIIPSIAMASWWNPFSWNVWNIFKKPQNIAVVSIDKEKLLDRNQDINIDNKIVDSKTNQTQAEPTKNIIKKENVINKTEENFRSQLVSLYEGKIKFLDEKIKRWELLKGIYDGNIADNKEGISTFENIRASIGYDTSYAVDIYRLEVSEEIKFSEIWKNRIDQYNKIKNKVDSELSDIKTNSLLITKAEYLLREAELNLLINKTDIEKTDTAIFNLPEYFTGSKRSEIDVLLLSKAEKDKANIGRELADMRTVLDNLDKQISANNIARMEAEAKIMPLIKQPTRISCNTTYNANNGNPSTICTDLSTYESIRCDTTYDANSGNPNMNCYSR
ncbi:MAG: hypothetical protein NT094_00860 [Candidatus Staskawiczbacteria bacterium]|nr:hypothetical protein [Candidatus Staskawiczbacteria bacterium]